MLSFMLSFINPIYRHGKKAKRHWNVACKKPSKMFQRIKLYSYGISILRIFSTSGPKKRGKKSKILACQGTGIEVPEEDDEDGGVPIVRC